MNNPNVNNFPNFNQNSNQKIYLMIKFILLDKKTGRTNIIKVPGNISMKIHELIKNFRKELSNKDMIIEYTLNNQNLDPNSDEIIRRKGINENSVIIATVK